MDLKKSKDELSLEERFIILWSCIKLGCNNEEELAEKIESDGNELDQIIKQATQEGYELFGTLKKEYAESEDRQYYTFDYLEQCFNEFDEVKNGLKNPNAVEFAIWWHAIRYHPELPKYTTCAFLANSTCSGYKLPNEFAHYVNNLILSLRPDKQIREEVEHDGKYLIDITKYPLGLPPSEYKIYELALKVELKDLTQQQYERIRHRNLLKLVENGLYNTEHFKNKYGKQAKENILNFLDS